MSFSITPSANIRNHPANNSTSKEIHAFSKEKRFIAPNPECPNAFYTYDSQLSNRKAAFGYGNKSDFTRTLTVSPPATKYEIKSFVDESREKGKSFGLHREKLPDNSYLVPQLHKIPGPGGVSIALFSTKTTRRKWAITASPCGPSPSTSSRRSSLTRSLRDRVRIKRSI